MFRPASALWRANALILGLVLTAVARAQTPPPMQLAETHHLGEPLDIPAYWVSEKYDGVRAWWDGQQLLSRSGHRLSAPAWFTACLPRDARLDGELWTRRGDFENLSGIVRRSVPDDADWRQIHYRVFDLPLAPGRFEQRHQRLLELKAAAGCRWFEVVEQRALADAPALASLLARVVADGGEGLMLRRRDAPYTAGRNRDLLKLKPADDAEAVVIAHQAGRGKYQGMVGALRVRRDDGAEFAIGSGLSDAQRRNPPPIGSTITYAYNGLTRSGLPRFARFVRVRQDP